MKKDCITISGQLGCLILGKGAVHIDAEAVKEEAVLIFPVLSFPWIGNKWVEQS